MYIHVAWTSVDSQLTQVKKDIDNDNNVKTFNHTEATSFCFSPIPRVTSWLDK